MADFDRVFLRLVAFFSLIAAVASFPTGRAQGPAPAPSSDGTAIDQGIAYVLMFVALVLTYLIHPLDASTL